MKRIGNGLVVSLIGIGLAASAARWLITPINHPDASDARVTAVAIQLVIGVALLAWGWRQDREDRRARGPQYQVFADGVVRLVIGVGLAATAMHWLMTPQSHPDASSLRTSLVWGQVLLGLWLMVSSRSRLREEVAAWPAGVKREFGVHNREKHLLSLRRFRLLIVTIGLALWPTLLQAQSEVPGPSADRRLGWRLERAWQLGGSDDESLILTLLSQKDLATDRRGRLYVIDRTESQVAVYDSTGRRVRSYGRKGSGPGELRFPVWLDVRQDDWLLVGDAEKNAVVVFAPDGGAEPELQLEPRLRAVRALSGGHVGLASRTRDSLVLVAYLNGQPVTMARMAVPRPNSTPPVCRITDYPVAPIFAPTIVWAARGNRVVTSTGDFRLRIFNGTTPQRVLTRGTPFRSSSRELAQQHLGPGITIQMAGLQPCTVPADMILDVAEVAPTLPAYSALALSPDDRIWATRYTVRGEPGLVDVYHADRGYEGTLPLGDVRPVAFLSTGLLVSLEHDQDDVPVIVGYRVRRN